ncbi:biotin transport system substrate-specific component [Paucidesulfovibrio gracilis DSM 16080]|uniref:Biotin transporter n=1 Tax=Paucidesulfovibrio gracilis DSM 16080 TaxID=1121449 RepID=A0A1T4XL42_9BACT|nr:biotin transporter BioY [Paucidesulfovibrio gracilis]SKA90309.1 biotin transport system substrate-specific component [Paucidesulfovibrio gracilis DSM 16080]
MSRMALGDLHKLVWTALLAAMIAAGAYLIVPIGPVPVSMQVLFITLAGLVLGPRRGMACFLLYLAVGAAGLPVFAGGASGVGVLMGPTAGYLYGFVVMIGIVGLATGGRSRMVSFVRGFLFGVLGLGAAYLGGVGWLMYSLEMSLHKAMAVGFYPFILWDLLKIVFATACYRILVRYSILR